MPIKKITNVTLRQQVYDQLKAQILAAELLPGEVISIRDLAEKFGVSLIPVREAVWQLETEKILVIKNSKNFQVNRLTKEEFKEILDIRLLLESEVIARACQLRSKKSIPKIEKIFNVMHESVATNKKLYIKKNDEFHQSIYSFARTPLFLDLIRRQLARVVPYAYLYAIKKVDLTGAMDCHKEMLEGFTSGDSERAVAGLREDLILAGKIMLPFLE